MPATELETPSLLPHSTRAPAPDWPRPLLVLMYHGIHASRKDHGHFDPRYSVTPQAFRAQMDILSRRGEGRWLPGDTDSTRGGNGETGAPFGQDSPPSVMLSFDDGDASNAECALPLLLELGLRAMFFVTSHYLRRSGWLSLAQLRALGDAGMGIGSHGASHRFLSELEDPELRRELVGSREVLQAVSGRSVDCLAFPGGRGGAREISLARDLGYQHVFGSKPGVNATPAGQAPVQRVAITRDTNIKDFRQILAWNGLAVQKLCWRHRVLALPKALIGDGRYDRLRRALLG